MPNEDKIKQLEIEDRRLEIRSEPVQEILSKAPSWMVRVGISLIFGFVVLILIAAWVIKYPDIVSSQLVVTGENPPTSLVARKSGKLETLFVEDGQKVKRGEVLGYLESIANPKDIAKLKDRLGWFAEFIDMPNTYAKFPFDTTLSLGEIQMEYANFLRYFYESVDFYETKFYEEKIKSLKSQISSFYALNEKLLYQKGIMAEDFTVAERLYDKDEQLYKSKVVSEMDFLNKRSLYLQKKYSVEGIAVSIINNTIQLNEYKKSILDLQQQERQRRRELEISIRSSYQQLLSSISSWEQSNAFIAPVSGEVVLFNYWSENQFVSANEEVMTIVGDSSTLLGKVMLPASGSGKVKLGQTVHVKFEDFPFNEYGIVKGKIVSISRVQRNNMYALDIEFPDGLVTTYDKKLPFKQDMKGVAEIITEDVRLLERVFYQLRSIIDNM